MAGNPVIGTDGYVPVYDPEGLWKIWNWDELWMGPDGPGQGKYVGKAGVPVEVSNRGAITERWALKMRSGGTQFDLYGRHLGLIASGSINEDFLPIHHAAGAPYFTLRALGWGSGWAAGNTLFIDTIGAEAPIDCVRCTQPSSPAGIDDSCWIVQRGDVGREPESGF